MIRYRPPLPAVVGLFGKPTIINNVITLASVPIIFDKGAAFYKNYGVGRSRGTLPFQLAGNIKRGGLVEKAFGLTLARIALRFRRRKLHRQTDSSGPDWWTAGRVPAGIAV